ncbi:MAG TPA: sn-glycerol-3-phosphate ABC transporter ATP-binding protein UgpC [Actinokineospora sp.]|jgi:multiple sugar transport system ATP-binding protein|nr:sn-glycerol-3-phosphate ABC transporter ATP-binding protein UgpC [Actinokineospora sp.]
MASVSYQGATRVYPGTDVPALDHLDLDIRNGEFMVLVGPSGSGKTTALRMLAGLEEVDQGAIHIGRSNVTNARPQDRDIAMVFQNYALYPHMTVAENLGFQLKIAKKTPAYITQKVREVAKMLDLEPYLDRKPPKLSGGQRQRVAMGRAIVREPRVFLMDEPLSNLDAKLRVQTRTQIASLQRRLGTTTVYVTHDQVEAMTMGDRVAVLNEGKLQQVDTPRRVFDRPANVFVAGFTGAPPMNLVELPVISSSLIRFGPYDLPTTPRQRAALKSKAITVGLRPSGLRVVGAGSGINATVEAVEELGEDNYLYLTAVTPYGEIPLVARCDRRNVPGRGMQVGLGIDPSQVHLFDTLTGVRLPD